MGAEDEDLFSDATEAINAPLRTARGAVVARAFVLRQVSGPGAPSETPLREEQLVVGRSKQANVVIDSPELSRRHLLLCKEGNEYVVRDLNSRNGVYLNGIKIHSAVLRGGDTLQVGNIAFVFLEGF